MVTALCMTGISIGCAAIIVAISIGNGAQSYLETEIIGGMKLDEITVTPQSTGGPGKAAANRREENGDCLRMIRFRSFRASITSNPL